MGKKNRNKNKTDGDSGTADDKKKTNWAGWLGGAGIAAGLATLFTPLGGILGKTASNNVMQTFEPCAVPIALMCMSAFCLICMMMIIPLLQ